MHKYRSTDRLCIRSTKSPHDNIKSDFQQFNAFRNGTSKRDLTISKRDGPLIESSNKRT